MNSPVKSVGLVFRLINLVYACYLRAGGEGMQGTTHAICSQRNSCEGVEINVDYGHRQSGWDKVQS